MPGNIQRGKQCRNMVDFVRLLFWRCSSFLMAQADLCSSSRDVSWTNPDDEAFGGKWFQSFFEGSRSVLFSWWISNFYVLRVVIGRSQNYDGSDTWCSIGAIFRNFQSSKALYLFCCPDSLIRAKLTLSTRLAVGGGGGGRVDSLSRTIVLGIEHNSMSSGYFVVSCGGVQNIRFLSSLLW